MSVYPLHERAPRRQLREVVRRIDLARSARPFTRCMTCNAELDAAAPDSVADRVPARVGRDYASFQRCGGCGRVYWPGSHHAGMRRLVDEVLAEDDAPVARRHPPSPRV